MHYRREVDGLRAIAVLSVLLCHGGFSPFSGGFVGVDVFFVISGYLITSIILNDLAAGRFSLKKFYERRARRILPALFLVMFSTIPFFYAWLLPDEFKNYGQSLFATATFSNNILLALTSDYWSVASEFKPFLHTWSLGVEEQYYMLFPLLMILCWSYCRSRLLLVISILLVASLTAAVWGMTRYPIATFYLLPTRGWEILMGAIAACHLVRKQAAAVPPICNQALSILGVLLILLAIFTFNQYFPSPVLAVFVPTVGAVLIVLFAQEGTIARRILGSPPLVGIGLISYSLYLWHQPVFALARIYSSDVVPPAVFGVLIVLVFSLAYLTWRFVETPFRNKAIIGGRDVAYFSVLASCSFVAFGLYLNSTYGMPWRVFDAQTRVQDIDKRSYNERVFQYKTASFSTHGKLKVLVVGNSFARDFVNMTVETLNMANVEIVYRDDLPVCIFPYRDKESESLYGFADIIVFASGENKGCVLNNVSFAGSHGKHIYYVGTKDFGRNLNWITRIPPDQRRNCFNPLPDDVVADESNLSSAVPAEHFISLLTPVVMGGRIPITDESGRMLSMDRRHVTKFGAIFFGKHALLGSPYGDILDSVNSKQRPGM